VEVASSFVASVTGIHVEKGIFAVSKPLAVNAAGKSSISVCMQIQMWPGDRVSLFIVIFVSDFVVRCTCTHVDSVLCVILCVQDDRCKTLDPSQPASTKLMI
jgi:hypothetical protein